MARFPVPLPRITGVLIILGAATMLSAWLGFALVRYAVAFSVGSALLAVVIAVIAYRHSRAWRWRLLAGWAALTVLAQLVFSVTSLHPALVVALSSTTILAVTTWVAAWATRRPARGTAVRVLRGVGLVVAAGAAVLSVLLVSVAADPRPLALVAQSAVGNGNSFEPRNVSQTVELRGSRYTNDIQYGSTYPNSFLDVYIAGDDSTVSRPTYVVVHGGGWITGSKNDGDPNAPTGSDAYFALGSQPLLDNGFNVVTLDYALAPGVPYPTPVIQLGEAMNFLEENGATYGLDMSRVVLAGGSAGGQIVGQYANIQTNQDYAKEMGIAPTLDADNLKAVVFDSAGLVPASLGRTEAPAFFNDWFFDLCGRTYFGTSAERLAEASVNAHVSADFPPSFIADGNTGTFPDQVAQLGEILTGLGVRNETELHPVEEAVLGHGYMAAASPSTDLYNEHKLAFLDEALGG